VPNSTICLHLACVSVGIILYRLTRITDVDAHCCTPFFFSRRLSGSRTTSEQRHAGGGPPSGDRLAEITLSDASARAPSSELWLPISSTQSALWLSCKSFPQKSKHTRNKTRHGFLKVCRTTIFIQQIVGSVYSISRYQMQYHIGIPC
jgi:hypothetical protein